LRANRLRTWVVVQHGGEDSGDRSRRLLQHCLQADAGAAVVDEGEHLPHGVPVGRGEVGRRLEPALKRVFVDEAVGCGKI
jgi:hypothetical protein